MKTYTSIYLGLGSNYRAVEHLQWALRSLQKSFGELALSPVYESEPVGVTGDNFLNLVLKTRTNMTVGKLRETLKQLEKRCMDNDFARGRRALDIDILMYGNTVGEVEGVALPRREILFNAFVLKPFSDLSPELKHPELQLTMAELWHDYHSDQQLWRRDTCLDDQLD